MAETLTDERLSNLPTWAQLALRVMRDHGVTALIAMFLVYFMVNLFAGDFKTMRGEVSTHVVKTDTALTALSSDMKVLSTDLNRHITHDDSSLQIQRNICVSVALLAKNQDAVRDCAK